MSEGILVTSGRHFFAGDRAHNGIRLSISRTDPGRIEEGIARLGQVLERLLREHRPARGRALSEAPPLV